LLSLIDFGINSLWIRNIKVASVEYATPLCTFWLDAALIGGIDAGVLNRGETEVWQAMGGQYLHCSKVFITFFTCARHGQMLRVSSPIQVLMAETVANPHYLSHLKS